MSLYETLTISIAIVGAVLSLISIAIVAFDLIFKLGKQRFEQYYHYGFKIASYYFKPVETKTQGLVFGDDPEKKISAAISIRAINKSAYPVTIDSIFVLNDKGNKNIQNYHDNDFSFKPIYETKKINGIPAKASLDVCEKVILPVTLQPYETKFFSVQIPHFEKYVTRYGDTVYPYLHFTTARKTYIIQVEVPEYHGVMSEPPREY